MTSVQLRRGGEFSPTVNPCWGPDALPREHSQQKKIDFFFENKQLDVFWQQNLKMWNACNNSMQTLKLACRFWTKSINQSLESWSQRSLGKVLHESTCFYGIFICKFYLPKIELTIMVFYHIAPKMGTVGQFLAHHVGRGAKHDSRLQTEMPRQLWQVFIVCDECSWKNNWKKGIL